MTDRRGVLALGVLAGAAVLAPWRAGLAAEDCSAAVRTEAIGSALLDRYVAAVNAHDTTSFPEIHTESYIQTSARSPSGLAAQIENFLGIFGRMPDVQTRGEAQIVQAVRVLPRISFPPHHTPPPPSS